MARAVVVRRSSAMPLASFAMMLAVAGATTNKSAQRARRCVPLANFLALRTYPDAPAGL